VFSTRKPGIALGTLGLLAALAACQNRSDQGEKSAADSESLAATKAAPIDTAKLKRMAMQRDSLKADSIARKTGQLPGALLPGHRIVAFYGNIRSKGMGILGREPKERHHHGAGCSRGRWQVPPHELEEYH
jgi:hypothetical protein